MHKLAGLQPLVMHKIDHHDSGMTVCDIVAAIDEAFPRLPDRTTGFEEYLATKAKYVFQKDHTAF